ANSPRTQISVVAERISPELRRLASGYPDVRLWERGFDSTDLYNNDLVMIAVNDPGVSTAVRAAAREMGKLVNVADKPALCDFYLSSVVRKGNLKIAISTNGKSPTVAKRLKEIFAE